MNVPNKKSISVLTKWQEGPGLTMFKKAVYAYMADREEGGGRGWGLHFQNRLGIILGPGNYHGKQRLRNSGWTEAQFIV